MDRFFTQDKCDRCGAKLFGRIMSWFNNDTICTNCSHKEREIKQALREKGDTRSYEGCGYIPNVGG